MTVRFPYRSNLMGYQFPSLLLPTLRSVGAVVFQLRAQVVDLVHLRAEAIAYLFPDSCGMSVMAHVFLSSTHSSSHSIILTMHL